MVPVGAQSINLVSELEQESRSNQVGVVLDAAVNLVVVELEGKRLVHCKKRGGNFHLTGGKITLYTISTMVDSRVFKFYTNLSV